MECSGTSVPVCTVPDVLLRTAPYCSVLYRIAPYWYVWYGTVMILYPGTSACVRGRADMGSGNLRDAISDARAKEARRLSQIRLRLGDELHRRERGCGVAGVGWRLGLHGVEIVARDCDLGQVCV